MQKLLVGDVPFYLKFWVKVTAWSEIADFRSIFARSASAVWPSEKRSRTLIGSPLGQRAFQWAQDGHGTLSLSPQRVAQKLNVSNIWTISCDICETARDRTSVTINHYIIGSRIRAFDCYLPLWPWVTLSGLIALILRFLAEFDCFTGQLRHSG